MDSAIAASRGLGKTIVPTIVVILGSCVFRIFWVYTIFAQFHTIFSPVQPVRLLLDHHSHSGDGVFPAYLS